MVPRQEIENRLGAFQGALREAGFAGALVVQATDLYYLAGTGQSAHLVVPAEGEPSLLVRRSLERARRESPLERIQPLRSLRDLGPALAEAGLAGGRLGLELDVIPAALYLDYARRLEVFELGDASPLIRNLRARKSPWEVEQIRRACDMVAKMTEWVPRVLREGMSEIELSAELERLLRYEGHQGLLRMRGFNGEMFYGSVVAGAGGATPGAADTPIVGQGPNIAIGKGASPLPIRRGDPVLVDLVGAWEGYMSDQTRTFSVGPLKPKFREAYEAAREILHRVAAEARPGVPSGRLYDLAHELAGGREGFMGVGEERVSFVGHGFGLEIDEPPFLARGHTAPLEEGHVFAWEPKFVFRGEGAVGVENSYLVVENGVEQLTYASEELIEV